MHTEFMGLKKEMIAIRKYEAERIRKMTVESNDALKELKRKSEKVNI